jgi:transposase
MWFSYVDSSCSPSSRDDASDIRQARTGGREHRPSRLQRRLARSLRKLANRPRPREAARRRFEVLLEDRLALVRADLLEIAALLERSSEPDPWCMTALHRLLTDGCESPLYNADVHPSELRATLFYVRARLIA